jgi:Carbohydrate binding domain
MATPRSAAHLSACALALPPRVARNSHGSHSKEVLTRDARHGDLRGLLGTALAAFCGLVLGAGCTTDHLDRLGSGRAPISEGSHATGTDAELGDPLRPNNTELDAGAIATRTDAGAPAPSPELIPNPSFESGHAGWFGLGDSRILDVADAHTGSRAMLSTNREASWAGPSYDVRSLVVAKQPYGVSAWVRNEFGTHPIMLTLELECGHDTTYTRLATRAVASDWLQIDASFFAPDCPDLEKLSVYVEGPPANKNLLVDDVSLHSISLSGGETIEL